MSALPDGLLTAVRKYLNITWADTAGDEKLTGIIARGMNRLNTVAGAALDYQLEGAPRELLFEYCRYARSNALEAFEANYLSELLALQIAQEVKDYEAASS